MKTICKFSALLTKKCVYLRTGLRYYWHPCKCKYRIVWKTRWPLLQDDLEYKTGNLEKISSYTFKKTEQP